ncbi:MAG: alpha/beta hydrolase [candidate division WOR-3 bacterium]|nr:alpha/beta hydrolase [candidate division WOR-3 bacterium]MCX7947336.1 alpha/beta hydrolase [candidate division WOR-3 bacterium]MDW8150108.1 alpha/beta hydrolase [candidate division WOR-3 bacterium]
MKNIVFLHAFPLNSKMWKYQVSKFKTYNCYAVDYQNLSINTLKDISDFVYSFCKESSIEKAIFVGLSMGGYVIFEIFRHYKQIAEAIVLCNTKATSDSAEMREKRHKIIERIKNEGTSFLADEYIAKFLENRNLENEKFIRDMINEAKAENLISIQLALSNRSDNVDLLDKIDIPTLIIASEKDEISTIEDAKLMNEKIKNSKLVILKNCKHISNIDCKDEFNRTLDEFLKSL